ncbi:dihydroneopterin triphosphate diphosphatase [Pseudazoarcus pumilus]|uniref:Dihydroneopterin triphosphate diphosphatase n=1 Tax=Pseudazoarcus pumilus TaxID=2067960 RepID=A0A2I6S4T4_9RHOO|nr:dihydroneopterin triphosphate diphosphatase [Pseudazoarcus pumilus]AUN94247.1 dihydroneopterin triphosphate diphosphatase [Pseudazoarcus pumilus]
MTAAAKPYKRPVSVLVVIHTPDLQVLLIERARPGGHWQSVTGSLEADETPLEAAVREVMEETGLVRDPSDFHDWRHTNRFRIRGQWRPMYAPEATHNTEHVFSVCIPEAVEVQLAPNEHVAQQWLPFEEAAALAFSWSNRDAILRLPELGAQRTR